MFVVAIASFCRHHRRGRHFRRRRRRRRRPQPSVFLHVYSLQAISLVFNTSC